MRYIFLFLVIISFKLTCKSQIKILNEDPFSHSTSQIDIKIVNNNILVPVDLGYELRLYFILDTGVKTTIITEPIIQNVIQLPLERKIKVRGYGNDEPLEAWVSTKFNFKLNDTYVFKNQDVIILDKGINLDQFLGEPVYGIIGHDFLSNHQITIDYYREKLIIKDPTNAKKIEKLRRNKRVKVLDIDFVGSKPFVYLPISNNNQTDTLKLLVDTGFSGALSLYPNPKSLQFLNNPYIDNYQGYGMNGLITSKFKKIESLSFDKNIQMNDISTHFIDSISLVNISHVKHSDGSIGNDILRRFKLSFDYENKKLYLKPLKSRIDDEFYFNNAGIRVLYQETDSGNINHLVQSVRKASNADEAGLKRGDIIVSINDKSIRHLKMTKIYQLLNDVTELKKELIVNRDGEQLSINFTLNSFTEWN